MKKIVLASTLFYALVAFEFFYMFSPFAVYLYSVYNPGLQFLSTSETTIRLVSFFMPHLTRETSNFFITRHEIFGWIFFWGGLGCFIVGAIQIYWSKLKKRTSVQGGLYQKIRHPQYLALMIAGFGMLLIWPRYLVLFAFVTQCFVYVWIARVEEGICARSFSDYSDYKARTGMFLPFRIEKKLPRLKLPKTVWKRRLAFACYYFFIMALSFLLADWIHGRSVKSLYTYETDNSVFLSIGHLETSGINQLAEIALADVRVQDLLEPEQSPNVRFLNYVMPTDLYISEIPMYLPDGKTFNHKNPDKKNGRYYKIIFSAAVFVSRSAPETGNIIRQAFTVNPIVEVWIDPNAGQVIAVHQPPEKRIYGNTPVPVF